MALSDLSQTTFLQIVALALEVINAVTVAVERPDLTQLRHLLLEDPDVCYEILQAVQSILTMPEDACGWWAHAAAQHVCTNKLTCLAGLARSSPEWLDEQRAIILSAHEGIGPAADTDELLTVMEGAWWPPCAFPGRLLGPPATTAHGLKRPVPGAPRSGRARPWKRRFGASG